MPKCKQCTDFFTKFQCGASLFGECDCPKCQGYCKCSQDTVDNFDAFWEAWPKHPRKGAKAACKKRWQKGLYDHCADQILKHIEWMKTTDQWRKDSGAFIPAPLVYLNQQRWDGAEIPEPKDTRDPALVKLDQDRNNATPMPEEVRLKLQQLRSKL